MNMTRTKRNAILSYSLLVLLAHSIAYGYEQTITIEEHLGYAWESDLVHKDIVVSKPGLLFPGKTVLYQGKEPAPMQLDDIQCYPDGSLKKAAVWFRTDLPARGKREFVLRSLDGEQLPGKARKTDLFVKITGHVLEVKNSYTAIRLPASQWRVSDVKASVKDRISALAERLGVPAEHALAGPLLGVKLTSGEWTAIGRIISDKSFLEYATDILDQGPIFVRVRVEYCFAEGGHYTATYTIRSGEPLVRVDEEYKDAGRLEVHLGAGLQPTKFADHIREADFTVRPIEYDKKDSLPCFVGWDLYLRDRSHVMAYFGGSKDDLLGLVTTDSDWLPFPYKQMWSIMAEPGPKLTATGSLKSGRRHYAFLVGKDADFAEPDTARAVYRWWNKHIAVPLDKVADWVLVWDGMDMIEFPHTFFGREDIEGIRARLQSDPDVKKFMTELRESKKGGPYSLYWWGYCESQCETEENKAQFAEYKARFYPKGIATSMSDIAAWYLYSGDRLYMEQLKQGIPRLCQESNQEFINWVYRSYIEGVGLATSHRMVHMEFTDDWWPRLVGLDMLLGSDVLTAKERRDLLKGLAFLCLLMHDEMWMPVNYPYYGDGSDYIGYAQGTESQKYDTWVTRALFAFLLKGHPHRDEWVEDAMATNARQMPHIINTDGAFYESPGYAMRWTGRIAPFWLAAGRAGIKGQDEWMDSAEKMFQFLGDLLSPPDPRFGRKRVYHALGRTSCGRIDPLLLIGVDPWGKTDPAHGMHMRYLWESMGRPMLEETGGPDTSLYIMSVSMPFQVPDKSPLVSRYWDGFGCILRSQAGSEFESNVLFKHDPFAWAFGYQNVGVVYFYGKGAPLSIAFGGYWKHKCQEIPFGNAVQFPKNNEYPAKEGKIEEYALLGGIADYAVSRTHAKDWGRSVLFAKDFDREDPVYILVRDDVSRQMPSALHWWIMSKDVQPQGLHSVGVIDPKISDEEWLSNLGNNWKDAPKLSGQLQHFNGQCGVDVDMFIIHPASPKIVTDADGYGPVVPYCVDNKYLEYQQLVRIEQPAGEGYSTLFVPRWPGSAQPEYLTIADGAGVAIKWAGGEDRLFLSDKKVAYNDEVVDFEGRAGFVRHGPAARLRLMVVDGRVAADGFTLACPSHAALVYDGKTIQVVCTGQAQDVKVVIPPADKEIPLSIQRIP